MTDLAAYVHIPFCARRCDYCAFATWTDRHHLIDRYVDAVIAHARRRFADGVGPVSSVFFGGGTPSLIDPGALVRILDVIPRHPDAEVTVECNPENVTADLLDTYLAGGVTRISMGVQSLVPEVLVALGREHDPAAVERAADLLRARPFGSWSIDLIYGGAGETLAQWQTTVEAALWLDPPHISAYALTIEAGTPLAADPTRHPDDDDLAAKYELLDGLLDASGRPWYEISNWARSGHACRHNELYWRQGDYEAFGCAAHGHRDGRRWWNVRTPDRYVELVAAGIDPEGGHEDLDPVVRSEERLQLALRTSEGVAQRHLPPDALAALPEGLVEAAGDRWVLTRAGRLLANEVALRLRS